MLNHLWRRVRETLAQARCVTLATSGPGGLQVGTFPCQAVDTQLYVLVPRTSDHLVNLEDDLGVVVMADTWQLRGQARVLPAAERPDDLALMGVPDARWSELIQVRPTRVELGRRSSWGYSETIDL